MSTVKRILGDYTISTVDLAGTVGTGNVTIDGLEPKVVSFRLPAGKAMKVGNALQQVRKAVKKIYQVELTLKLVPNKDKKNINPDIEVEFNPDVVLSTRDKVFAKATLEIQNFINKNNEAVRQSHFNAAKQKQDNTTASKVVNKILNKQVEQEDEEVEDNDLDDEIPFD